MDGVLFDSMPAHAHSWHKVCTEYGLDMTLEEVYLNEGRTGFSTINMLTQRQYGRDTTEEEVQHIYNLKCREFNKYPAAPKMTGAEEVLRAVQERGLMALVVTGSAQDSLLTRLETNYPGSFAPERIVSGNDVKYGKPHPEPYLMGLAKAGRLLNADGRPLDPSEALVVENAPLGVQAGVAAGIFTIAVNTGPLADKVLLDAGANALFPSMTQLAKAITI